MNGGNFFIDRAIGLTKAGEVGRHNAHPPTGTGVQAAYKGFAHFTHPKGVTTEGIRTSVDS